MRIQKFIRTKRSKHGFTLVELVVVMAIMAICSCMLVGVVASTIDRYTISTDVETRKQEAVNFETYYCKYGRAAFEIEENAAYGSPAFSIQDNYYYMEMNPTTRNIQFFTSNGSGGRVNIIDCKNVKKFTHYTEKLGENDKKVVLHFSIVMENGYEPNQDYTYEGSCILNNGSGIDIPSIEYDFDSMVSNICISFRMIP